MPYIKHTVRRLIDKLWTIPENAGELNYLLTKHCIDYINTHGESYQTYNDIIGALEGCKMEIYRRKVADYEDVKIKENGDVY